MSAYDTYHSWAATQYREKVCLISFSINILVLTPTAHSWTQISQENLGRPHRDRLVQPRRGAPQVHRVGLLPPRGFVNPGPLREVTQGVHPPRRLMRRPPAHRILCRGLSQRKIRSRRTNPISQASVRSMLHGLTICHHLRAAGIRDSAARLHLPTIRHTECHPPLYRG